MQTAWRILLLGACRKIDDMGDAGVDIEIVSSKAGYHIACHRPRAASLAYSDYTVGWICALPKELTAATAILDQIHPNLPKSPDDRNAYTLGSIGKHNIVIACLPKEGTGNASISISATQMARTFPFLKFSLLVGIGGGIPPKVSLGDVVVSTPGDGHQGVVEWDFGKAENGRLFGRVGRHNSPPVALLTALAKMESQGELWGHKIPQYLDDMAMKWPNMVPGYTHAPCRKGHRAARTDFAPEQVKLEAPESQSEDMRVHYGLIASGSQAVTDAKFRDSLDECLGGDVLCLETGAAGLVDDFPCLVIRGISNYADSQTTDEWQEHAAGVATACAKELLQYVQPSDVVGERSTEDILSHVVDRLESLRSKMDRNEDLEILDWLTPIDYGPRHSELIRQRQPGTGQWFLDSDEYYSWRTSGCQTLFCPGIPGAGKTMMTAIVIHDLTTRLLQDQSVGIAYLYCNFRHKDEQGLEDLLASLLKQLCQDRPFLPDIVRHFYNKHKNKRTRPLLGEIIQAVISVAAMYSRVFIIVDALDECQASDGYLSGFLTQLIHLQAQCGLNIFVTSRLVPQVMEKFKSSTKLEIRAHDQDIRRYLSARISQLQRTLLASRVDEVHDNITKAADGMFLLAQLQFESVRTQKTIKKVRGALKRLPIGVAYEHVYNDTMQRIRELDSNSRDLAKDTLSWITFAKRPLSPAELQHALAVEHDEPDLDHDNLPQVEEMISVCAGLITVDKDSNIIRFAHYTMKEYFQQAQKHWFPDAEVKITRTCISYLSFHAFETGPCQTGRELTERLQMYPLYDYAACNWGHHARDASTLCPEAVKFLNYDGKIQDVPGRALLLRRSRDEDSGQLDH
ncbi:nucleoside phosphorylase [Aspergillus candidus]|uniref:Nucleoside phosphorylase n=1 Tax=Aspergillus candidus TaxID=41067 RepID=A0A2I2F801_ASPCN|nr:nucleoside phosphorylase [Aspergillus candidus]PLB36747.1 nucleoside phosphorylase [Aspergillus candidus]